MSRLRMYIVIRGDLSPTAAFIAYGHATLGTYLTYETDVLMQEWKKTSFVKIALKALNKTHFDWCKKLGEHRVFTESSLGNAETCIGFRVVRDPDARFKYLEKWVQMEEPNV